MSTSRDTHRSQQKRQEGYDRTRKDFQSMNLEDQATFWVEATASLLARGVQEAGHAIARELDTLFEGTGRASHSKSDADGSPGPAEPETAQQRTPRGDSSV